MDTLLLIAVEGEDKAPLSEPNRDTVVALNELAEAGQHDINLGGSPAVVHLEVLYGNNNTPLRRCSIRITHHGHVADSFACELMRMPLPSSAPSLLPYRCPTA